MTWTSPRNWVTSEVVTSAEMNANVRDNTNFLYAANSCEIANGAGQNIGNAGSWTAITLGTMIIDTTGSMAGTTLSSILIPVDGFYQLTASVSVRGNMDRPVTLGSRIHVNGGTAQREMYSGNPLSASVPGVTATAWETKWLAANDAVTMQGYQYATGASFNVTAELAATYIGTGGTH